ncbi:heme-binding protein [Novosphingobium sp. Gsoil 351]|uniref:GlcG/HbpS family heme-binding protein n=1 Tax=Novosphingobium sp. Gsoil 351 TaxID=2675225 RepID=UPI0012B48624|nr:heme-binding protein [Novosphingobium sp. Gsoil 351]QGN55862.1 heme-binding protein [Novosphingobium sp. Gsoil 351]
MSVKLGTAQEIARVAFAEGEKQGLMVMSVVVTDPGGHVRLAMRSDAQGIFGVDTALGKARTALGFNRSSWLLSKTFVDPCGVASLNGATGGAFLPLGGGVVIQHDGVTVGAAAISGGMPEVDDTLIRQAVEAAGLTALP